METTNIYIHAACAAGWARKNKFTDAVREMCRFARSTINPDKMTLSEFLKAVDDQKINLWLVADTGENPERPVCRDFATLGDDYNDAKIYNTHLVWDKEV